MIGFLAFSAAHNSEQNRPPVGAQSGVPGGGRLVGSQAPPGPTELTASQAQANAAAPGAPAAQSSATFVTFGGGTGGQAPASAGRGSCTPGLVASLVGLVGALLGGGGASC
jgi:hypothetical protein